MLNCICLKHEEKPAKTGALITSFASPDSTCRSDTGAVERFCERRRLLQPDGVCLPWVQATISVSCQSRKDVRGTWGKTKGWRLKMVAAPTDLWTALTTESYVTISCQFHSELGFGDHCPTNTQYWWAAKHRKHSGPHQSSCRGVVCVCNGVRLKLHLVSIVPYLSLYNSK